MKQENKEIKKAHAIDFRMFPMDLGRFLISPLHLILRIQKRGKAASAIKGTGAIIVANHVSYYDPMVVCITFWQRRMHYLVAEAVMRNPMLKLLMGELGGIRIDRNISDIEAIRKAVTVLKRGRCLAIFPQGGIRVGEEQLQIKSGAILIALKADVPIVPMYTEMRTHWYHRKHIVIGEPMYCKEYCTKKFPGMAEIQMLTEELQNRMQACADEYHRWEMER